MTVASVCTESGVLPAVASVFDSDIVKHDASAAPISCSGFDPGPSSKRDLNVNPPLIESPAVNVPVPDFRSPFHSALPFAGMLSSSFGVRRLTHSVTRLTVTASG